MIARFTQEDVYRGDGLNLYVYVVNNPLLWIDPSGYAKKCSNRQSIRTEDRFKTNETLKNAKIVVKIGNSTREYSPLELQKAVDSIHEAAYGHKERKELLADGSEVKKYTFKDQKGGNAPIALTITSDGDIILSSNTKLKDKSIQKAYELFGAENVTIVGSKKENNYKNDLVKEQVTKTLLEQLKSYEATLPTGKATDIIKRKFKFGDNHAEVRGIQEIITRNGNAIGSSQFCSHLSCPSCTLIQSIEGVANYTGYSESLVKYSYMRDYTHIDN